LGCEEKLLWNYCITG